MTTNGLEKLNVWSKSRELVNDVYHLVIPLLPDEEKYNLSSQIRRSVTSIPSNIAEGYGRYYYQSNIQFCYIARGSLEESISHLMLAFDHGYIDEALYLQVIEKANNLVLLLNGYISYLKRSKTGENEPGFEKHIKENLPVYQSADIMTDLDESQVSILDSRTEGS